MKGDFVSRDADVAAESEKDERVKDDAEYSGGEQVEVVRGIPFRQVLRRDPAPEAATTDSIMWSSLWFGDDKI